MLDSEALLIAAMAESHTRRRRTPLSADSATAFEYFTWLGVFARR